MCRREDKNNRRFLSLCTIHIVSKTWTISGLELTKQAALVSQQAHLHSANNGSTHVYHYSFFLKIYKLEF